MARCSQAPSFPHGTTLATNAVLERKGAKTGLVTTTGFANILNIGRQQRPHLYKLDSSRSQQIVDTKVCFEISERVSAQGEILTAPAQKEIGVVAEQIQAKGVDSVAICFLFSFLNPENEHIVRDSLCKSGLAVSCSSEVLPEFREYERMSTTVLDAYLKRTVERYLTSMETLLAKTGVEHFYVMQSNGGVVKAGVMKHKPVNMLLSGPAGGVAAAKYLSTLLGRANIITFDMGGTSADVSTIINGNLSWTSEGSINGLPLTMPMINIVTVGAGGGSIAWIDDGGALRVGPESAGASPGPICYGLGGTDVTVTDCDLLCGFLNPNYFVGGEMVLDAAKAKRRVEQFANRIGMSYEDTILGVWKIVNANTIKALRLVSVEKGLDVRDFVVCAFGGAGPVHAAALAQELGIPKVIVPFASGVFSAYGILVSDVHLDYSRTHLLRVNDGEQEAEMVVKETLAIFSDEAQRELAEQDIDFENATLLPSLDMRYVGQSYEINVGFTTVAEVQTKFHERHNQLYGYAVPAEDIELVTIRLRVLVPRKKPELPKARVEAAGEPVEERMVLFEGGQEYVPVYRRVDLPAYFEHEGAAIIEGRDSTTVVLPGMQFSVDTYGNIVICK